MPNELKIMDPVKGDYRVTWDPDNAAEVAEAREQFKRLRGKGMMAYTVDRKGGQGKVLTEFDPKEEAIIFAPAVAGG